jgi:hypothetical protein
MNFRNYLLANRFYTILSVLYILVIWFTFFNNDFVSSGDDIFFVASREGGSISGVLNRNYLEGRWFIGFLFELVAGFSSPILLKIVTVICNILTILLLCYAFKKYIHGKSLFIVATLLGTSPFLLSISTFPLSYVFISLALLFSTLAYLILEYARIEKKPIYSLISVFLLVLSVGTYQPTVVVFLMLVISNFINNPEKKNFKNIAFMLSIGVLAFFVNSVIVHFLLNYYTNATSIARAQLWGYTEPKTFVDYIFHTIDVHKYYLSNFLNKEALAPDFGLPVPTYIIKFETLFLVFALFLVWVFMIIYFVIHRKFKIYLYQILAPLLWLSLSVFVLLLPFSMSGSYVIFRATFLSSLILPISFIYVKKLYSKINIGKLKSKIRLVVYTLLILCILLQSYYLNFGFYTQNLSFERSKEHYRSIAYQVSANEHYIGQTIYFYDVNGNNENNWPYLIGKNTSTAAVKRFSQYYLGLNMNLANLHFEKTLLPELLNVPEFQKLTWMFIKSNISIPRVVCVSMKDKNYFIALTNTKSLDFLSKINYSFLPIELMKLN